jgi:hypothetical protein
MKKNVFLIILICLINKSVAQDISNGIIAYFPFNKNYKDYGINHYSSTPYNVSFTQDRNGADSSAIAFNGADSYISLSNGIFGNGNKISFSVWAYAPEYDGNAWPQILSSTTTNIAYNIAIGIWQNTDHLHLEVQTTNGNFPMEGNISIPWNTWFHAVLVYDGDSLTEYLNGIKGRSIPASGNLISTADITIGWSSGSTNYFTGKLDELKVYNRDLSEEEVIDLYNYNKSCLAPVAFYPFTQNVDDESGDGYNGTNYGATPTANRFGNDTGAYFFDGNSYISLPVNTIGAWSQITMTAWANVPEYTGTYWPQFIASMVDLNWENVALGIYQNTGHLHTEVQTENGNFPMEGEIDIPWNTWFHAAMVYDGHYLTEYLNGVKGKSIPASGIISPISFLDIGLSPNSLDFLTGSIDEIKVFDCALSQEDIEALYGGNAILNNVSAVNTENSIYVAPSFIENEARLFDTQNAVEKILVYNILGIYVDSMDANQTLNFSHLKKGVYIIEFENANNNIMKYQKINKL